MFADSFRQRPFFFIGGIKRLAETAKEAGHRKIRLAIAVINGGIENHRLPVGQHSLVSSPQISMQERRGRLM